jgi:hypothetical protein
MEKWKISVRTRLFVNAFSENEKNSPGRFRRLVIAREHGVTDSSDRGNLGRGIPVSRLLRHVVPRNDGRRGGSRMGERMKKVKIGTRIT